MIKQITLSSFFLSRGLGSPCRNCLGSVAVQDMDATPVFLPAAWDQSIGDGPEWVGDTTICSSGQKVERVAKLVLDPWLSQGAKINAKRQFAKGVQGELQKMALQIDRLLICDMGVNHSAKIISRGTEGTTNEGAIKLGRENIGSGLAVEAPLVTVRYKDAAAQDIGQLLAKDFTLDIVVKIGCREREREIER